MTSAAVDLNETRPHQSGGGSFRRHEWPYLVVLVAMLGLLYAWQLQPGLNSHGDISKFQFVGPLAGTAHQTGYPLYLMLTWLAGQMPFVDIPTSATAVSALFGIGTAVAIYVALRELAVRPLLAFSFSLLLGVAPIVFYYAVVAEVYSAHLFFMAAVLAALLRWRRTESDLDLALAIVLLALSFTNHITTALLVPGILWFVWRTDAGTFRRPGVWLFGVASLVAAMSSYGYLIWRATDPNTVFVEVAPQSWLDLPSILIGSGGAMLVLGPSELDVLLSHVPRLVVDIARYALVMVPLAVAGFRVLWRNAAGTMLLTWIIASVGFALIFDSPNPQSFLPPIAFVLVVVGAVGAEWIITGYLPSRWVVVALLVLLVGASIAYGAWFVEFQSTEEYDARTRSWYAELPENAVLTASYSDAMAAYYLALLEGERTDVSTISDSPIADPAGSVLGRYLDGEPAVVPPQRQRVTPGRAVYAAGRDWACELARVGFEVEPYTAELYRVHGLRPGHDATEVGAVCASV